MALNHESRLSRRFPRQATQSTPRACKQLRIPHILDFFASPSERLLEQLCLSRFPQYKPTDCEILAEYYMVRQTRREYRPRKKDPAAPMSKNKFKIFHLHLRYRKPWAVAYNRVEHLLFQQFSSVFTDLIGVTPEQMALEYEHEHHEKSLRQLPAVKERTAKAPPMIPEERKPSRKQEQAAMALKFQRTQPPARNVHTELAKDKKVRQNKNTPSRILLRNDPSYKSLIRIMHQFNYEDTSVPDKHRTALGVSCESMVLSSCYYINFVDNIDCLI
jgi:hypothetical protein